MDRSGPEWNGVVWSGMEWIGVDRSGIEWIGVEWIYYFSTTGGKCHVARDLSDASTVYLSDKRVLPRVSILSRDSLRNPEVERTFPSLYLRTIIDLQ